MEVMMMAGEPDIAGMARRAIELAVERLRSRIRTIDRYDVALMRDDLRLVTDRLATLERESALRLEALVHTNGKDAETIGQLRDRLATLDRKLDETAYACERAVALGVDNSEWFAGLAAEARALLQSQKETQ